MLISPRDLPPPAVYSPLMVVADVIFDAVLFGLFLLGLVVDHQFPVLHGVATLLATLAAAYLAAQEWVHLWHRMRPAAPASETPSTAPHPVLNDLSDSSIPGQQSLSSSITLAIILFIYFWWRNQSDLALLILSIALMMTSLMLTVSLLAALSTGRRTGRVTPLVDWMVISAGALVLGVLGGFFTLDGPFIPRLMIVVLGVALWKAREHRVPVVRGVAGVPGAPPVTPATPAAAEVAGAAPSHPLHSPLPEFHHAGLMLLPRRGYMLDRLVPVLILGSLLVILTGRLGHPVPGITPSTAANRLPAPAAVSRP